MKTSISTILFVLLPVAGCGEGVPGESQAGFDISFPKYVDVFGISIRGTSKTPNDKMLHAAHVMAQYLDNDADGEPDNALVIAAMRADNATLLMTLDRDELDEFGFENLPDGEFQDLNAAETRPNGVAKNEFDATLEEVLHLITHVGYAGAYPQVFGEQPDSRLGDAMDLARGGRFMTIPSAYPAAAWYSYYDQTCDYGCMAAEYFYWALTTKLGAQDFPGREDEISDEWRLNTPAELEQHDVAVFALLSDAAYKLPTTLPNGQYQGGPIRFSPLAAD